MTNLRCGKHNIALESLGGESAHRSNWYCPICDATNSVIDDVKNERVRQFEKWDGVFSDDNYTPGDWYALIKDYNCWARRMGCMGSTDKYRRRLIQIAALAVAAVEALDRDIENDNSARNEEALLKSGE